MRGEISRRLPLFVILGFAFPAVSFLIGPIFGLEWPPLSLRSVAVSLIVGFAHAAYFLPAYFVITSRPRTTRDRVVLATTWGFLGLMMAVAPLQDTLRYGLDGLRFNGPLVALEVCAFVLIGLVQGRMMQKDSADGDGTATTPDVA